MNSRFRDERTSPFATPEDRVRERLSKRAAVLETAAHLFCSKGYNATQISDIADALGVSKPTIYYYFKNKEEVLVACFEAGYRMVNDAFAKQQAGETGRDRLRSVCLAYALVMTRDFGKCTVRVPVNEMSEDSKERINRHRRRFDGMVRTLIAEAVQDGSLPPQDPKWATFTLIGSLNWIAQWHRSDGPERDEDLARIIVDQAFGGLHHGQPVANAGDGSTAANRDP